MLDTIVSLLKESGVTAWEISDVKTTAWEFYFIRHALDQNRVRKVEHITVKVYQLLEDGAWLGSASGEIAPTASPEEARALIESLAHAGEEQSLYPPQAAPGGGGGAAARRRRGHRPGLRGDHAGSARDAGGGRQQL